VRAENKTQLLSSREHLNIKNNTWQGKRVLAGKRQKADKTEFCPQFILQKEEFMNKIKVNKKKPAA
jgi:hypothetical protein